MPVKFTCPHCSQTTNVPDEYLGQSGPCAGCGKTVTIPRPGSPFGGPATGPTTGPAVSPSMGEDASMRMLLPVGRSFWAIAAGYAGLFAVLMFPAPVALVLGIVAIRDIKRNPDKHGMGRAIFGLVMGGLFTILLSIVLFGLLAGW